MGAWNPYLAIGKIKARGILVDIAKDSHSEKIADGVSKVAKLFFGIYSVEQEIKARRHILALQRKVLQYWRTLHRQKRISDVEFKAHRHTLEKQQLQLKYLEQQREYLVSDLKLAIGYHPDYHLPLDTRDAPNQILAGVRGDLITFTDIQARNLNLRMLAKREQLQSSLVTGAYVELLPRPMLIMESLSNEVDRSSGFNFGFGLNYNIWDGFKRVRNIRRQKMEMRQLNLDRNMLSKKLYIEYRKLHTSLEMSAEKERLFHEAVRLAEYRADQAYSQYTAGRSQYPSYIRAVISKLQSKMEGLNLLQERVTAMIDLATLAGGLNRYNGAISR
jgi:outer membrane protein TolC